MSEQEEKPCNAAAVELVQRWLKEYGSHLSISPLEDIDQLVAQLDVTHAHPSGIAQLFAGGQAYMSSLFRDSGMLRAASRRLSRVLQDRDMKSQVSGVAELSMIVGVAQWMGKGMPVLLYPITVAAASHDPMVAHKGEQIQFTGRVRLNPTFIRVMHKHGITLDESELFNGNNYANGTPETSQVFRNICQQASTVFPDFDIDRRIVIGCFMDPSELVLIEGEQLLDRLSRNEGQTPLVETFMATARNEAPQHEPLSYSPFDNDPHVEYGIGDVDNTVRFAADQVAQGHSIALDCARLSDTVQYAASIASQCIMQGKSVVYVPCVADQKNRFQRVCRREHIAPLVFDMADAQLDERVDRALIDAVSYQGGANVANFERIADELVGVRSRLTRYLGDLHGVNQRWGVSGYQTIQQLAGLAALPSQPSTHVRLSEHTALQLIDHMDAWSEKLQEAGRLGEFEIGPDSTPWYHAHIESADEARLMLERVGALLSDLLPKTREQVTATVQTCGFPVPATAHEWARQVSVLKNLRRVLDVFQPEIFERDIALLIQASKSKQQRKADGVRMGFWERRRCLREARSMLRVGAQVENLHDALLVVAKQAEQWSMFVPHGGWPVLPAKLDEIIATQERLLEHLGALETVLATTPAGAHLSDCEFAELEQRLKALHDDSAALDTLPRRCVLEREFDEIGLSELVADLRSRKVAQSSIDAELRLSWWTTVFEDIVRSSQIISHQDGTALQSTADRFCHVDAEHIASIGPMVLDTLSQRLRDVLFAHPQEANQLHTLIAGSARVPLSRLVHDYPQLLGSAVPILVATPSTLAALSDPEPLADVVILDACSHMPSLQLLSVLARARQLVVLTHRATITSPGLRLLVNALPSIQVPERSVLRHADLNQFLTDHGYGVTRSYPVKQQIQGSICYHLVDAKGLPVVSTGLVESTQQEVEKIVELIVQRASKFTVVPADYILAVVTLTNTQRTRLGSELRNLAGRDSVMAKFLRHVRLVGITEVAGAYATDVIISMSYAKTVHGRLMHQFGALEREQSAGFLLDAVAMPDRHLDIVTSFSADDLEDERLHQSGELLLKELLQWASQYVQSAGTTAAGTAGATGAAGQSAASHAQFSEREGGEGEHQPTQVQSVQPRIVNVLMQDLAARVRARGLRVETDFGVSDGLKIPMVVGLEGEAFALAIMSDDSQFMTTQSTRRRHRTVEHELKTLGWSVLSVWSVAAFVNPDKEVDRIVAKLGEIYQELH